MADEEAQGPEDTSWWASDDGADASPLSASFDEPLIWPETPPWVDPAQADGPKPGALPPPLHTPIGSDLDGELLFPPGPEVPATVGPGSEADLDAQWGALGAGDDPDATIAHVEPLAALGGNAGPGRPPTAAVVDELPLEPLPQSIWSYDVGPPEELVGMGAAPAPAVYAEAEHGIPGPKGRRFDARPGNAAVIALISVVSLVLLGMFLSVRARSNDVPTDTSQPRPPVDEIAVTGALNTVPLTTAVTPAGAEPGIDIAGLIPPTDAPATATPGTSATTAPATRSTSPPATAATTPAAQPTATTAAPTTTAPPVTSPPVDDTAPATPRRSIPLPTFTVPTYTIPTFPSSTIHRAVP